MYSEEEVRPQAESYTVNNIVDQYKVPTETDRPLLSSFENEFGSFMEDSVSTEVATMHYKHPQQVKEEQTRTEVQTHPNEQESTEGKLRTIVEGLRAAPPLFDDITTHSQC